MVIKNVPLHLVRTTEKMKGEVNYTCMENLLHNLSFFAKNEKWFGEKFFAKNGPRKNSRKNAAKMPKASKTANFAKMKQDFD